MLADDKLVVGGTREWNQRDDPTMWRFEEDGSLDRSFGTSDGRTHIPFGGEVQGHWIVRDESDESYYLVGSLFANGLAAWNTISHISKDGLVDQDYRDSGQTQYAPTQEDMVIRQIALDSERRLVLIGSAKVASFNDNRDLFIARLLPSGEPDPSFGENGFRLLGSSVDGENVHDDGYSLVIDSNNQIFVAGSVFNDMAVWKFRSDGSLDLNFGVNGVSLIDGGFGTDVAKSIVFDDSGFLIAGNFEEELTNLSNAAIVRLRSNGSIDTDFASQGYFVFDSGGDDRVNVMLVDDKKRIVLGGQSQGEDNSLDASIWRFNRTKR